MFFLLFQNNPTKKIQGPLKKSERICLQITSLSPKLSLLTDEFISKTCTITDLNKVSTLSKYHHRHYSIITVPFIITPVSETEKYGMVEIKFGKKSEINYQKPSYTSNRRLHVFPKYLSEQEKNHHQQL